MGGDHNPRTPYSKPIDNATQKIEKNMDGKEVTMGKNNELEIKISSSTAAQESKDENHGMKQERCREQGALVTYRERLGGYLHPRDMRKLVTPFSPSNEPELIVRRHAMLLNFDTLRAIILRDRLLVIVPDGADSILAELERRVRGDDMDFNQEMRKNSSNYESAGSQYDEFDDKNSEETEKGAKPLLKITSLSFSDAKKDCKREHFKEVSPEDLIAKAETKINQHESSGNLGDRLGTDPMNDSFVDNEWDELEGKDWIDLPFELQSLDAVLNSVSAVLADDVLDLKLGANWMISQLMSTRSELGDNAQEVLRNIKNSLKEMTSRVQGFCRAIEAILEEDEDMALMNLSRLLTHPDRFIQPVPQAILEEESDEPELILEAHLQRGNTLANALILVAGQISTSEDFAERKSDLIRNRLLYVNMLIMILTLAVAAASFIGSIFGMNITNHHEDDPYAFVVIVGTTVVACILFVIFLLVGLNRVGAIPSLF